MQLITIDIGTLIPESHLLKKIHNSINFDFIYEIMSPYYSETGRKSIDPVSLIKMLFVGFLYGIKSEWRLAEEINLNIAYRWFCGFDITYKIPDHSLFSQNRKRRFTDSAVFRDIFNQVVRLCAEKGLVTGETTVSDGTFMPSNIANNSLFEVVHEAKKNAVRYLDALDEELWQAPGFKEPAPIIEEKTTWESATGPEGSYIDQRRKRALAICRK